MQGCNGMLLRNIFFNVAQSILQAKETIRGKNNFNTLF